MSKDEAEWFELGVEFGKTMKSLEQKLRSIGVTQTEIDKLTHREFESQLSQGGERVYQEWRAHQCPNEGGVSGDTTVDCGVCQRYWRAEISL